MLHWGRARVVERGSQATDLDRIERFAVMSGLAAQSVDAMRSRFPRWLRKMNEAGITRIPTVPWVPDNDPRAVNMLNMFILQAAPEGNRTMAHELRNLTGIRPYKL
jgi:hypothetical protein